MGGRVTEFSLRLNLIGSGGADLMPHLVLAEAMFARNFIDRRTVRLIAVPLFIASALLSDYHFGWTGGCLR